MSTRTRANLKFLVEYRVIRDNGLGQNGLRPSEGKNDFGEIAVKRVKWQNGRVTTQLSGEEKAHCAAANLYEPPTSVMITAQKGAVAVRGDVSRQGLPPDTIWSSIGFDDSQHQIRLQYGPTQKYRLSVGRNSTWARLIPDNHLETGQANAQGPRPLAGAPALIIALAILSNPANPDVLTTGFRTQSNGDRGWAPSSGERRANVGVVVSLYTWNVPPTNAGSSRDDLNSLCRGTDNLGPVFDR